MLKLWKFRQLVPLVAWWLALDTACCRRWRGCPGLPLPQDNGLHLHKSRLLSKGSLHPMTFQCWVWRPDSLARPSLAPDVWGQGLSLCSDSSACQLPRLGPSLFTPRRGRSWANSPVSTLCASLCVMLSSVRIHENQPHQVWTAKESGFAWNHLHKVMSYQRSREAGLG